MWNVTREHTSNSENAVILLRSERSGFWPSMVIFRNFQEPIMSKNVQIPPPPTPNWSSGKRSWSNENILWKLHRTVIFRQLLRNWFRFELSRAIPVYFSNMSCFGLPSQCGASPTQDPFLRHEKTALPVISRNPLLHWKRAVRVALLNFHEPCATDFNGWQSPDGMNNGSQLLTFYYMLCWLLAE